jgi:hypothetical protein
MDDEQRDLIRQALAVIEETRERIAGLDETLSALRDHCVSEGADLATLDVLQATAVEVAPLHALDANTRRLVAALERA